MTPKERAAMQQALDALENAYENGFLTGITGLKTIDIITALREALDHSGEANEMVIIWEAIDKEQLRRYKEKFGDFEQAEQADGEQWSPDDMAYRPSGLSMMQTDREVLKNLVRDMRIDVELKQKVYAALAEQAEQEPVGIVWDASAPVVMDSSAPKNENQEVAELRKQVAALKAVLDAWNNVEQEPMYISESCAQRGCACHYSVEVDGEPVTVYAAPVRTKYLTDDEIRKLWNDAELDITWFARAVIAADREKNK